MNAPDPSSEFPAAIERVVRTAHRPLSWLWQRGFRMLFVLDVLALYVSMVAVNVVRFSLDWPTYSAAHYYVNFAIATVLHVTVNYFLGLYEREPRLGVRSWFPRVTVSMAIGTAIGGLAVLMTDRYLMPRANLAGVFVLASVLLAANRHVSRALARRRQGPSRVLLVGSDDAIALASRHFDEAISRDATIVATTASLDEIIPLLERECPTDVLLLDLAAFESAFPEPITTIDDHEVGIHQRVSAREVLLGLRSVHQIAGLPFTRVRTDVLASHQARLKRFFDLLAVIAFSPVIVVVLAGLALYVRARAGRGVLYRQVRVGRDGEHFTMVKFRTMGHDAEATGAQLATRDDARVVPGLGWMRTTRADELPQLWNVARGEMSLVGPRPERPELTAEIGRTVAGYERRHRLAPGLTGLAQIQGRYDTHADFKLGYDLQYAVNWSLVLDVQILLRTVWVVLARRV